MINERWVSKIDFSFFFPPVPREGTRSNLSSINDQHKPAFTTILIMPGHNNTHAGGLRKRIQSKVFFAQSVRTSGENSCCATLLGRRLMGQSNESTKKLSDHESQNFHRQRVKKKCKETRGKESGITRSLQWEVLSTMGEEGPHGNEFHHHYHWLLRFRSH